MSSLNIYINYEKKYFSKRYSKILLKILSQWTMELYTRWILFLVHLCFLFTWLSISIQRNDIEKHGLVHLKLTQPCPRSKGTWGMLKTFLSGPGACWKLSKVKWKQKNMQQVSVLFGVCLPELGWQERSKWLLLLHINWREPNPQVNTHYLSFSSGFWSFRNNCRAGG